ncbi:low-density lipoprotein receptor-related protein 2-like [Scylla paramamosain]|uniref:low-density lipoprotein receptor-related protein 2-like n=1 Tax=Scylla paramamosain TaxID=85552 RepID=UPI003082BCF6
MGGSKESVVMVVLVAALVVLVPLHCRGQNAPSVEDWKGLDETVGANKAVASRIIKGMRNFAHLRQTIGCTPDVHESQKLVLKKTELYAREMAFLVTTLYREVRWFKEAAEDACLSECQQSEWRCKSGQCIPLYLRCDGRGNCNDGSDETPLCQGCGPDEFRCAADNTCLPSWTRCDGVYHCTDGADEHCQDSCSSGEFLCPYDRRCLPASWTCDGELDCSDGADERLCSDIEEDNTSPAQVCRPGEFRCATGNMCFSLDLLCNGVGNCYDASDESESLCPQTTTPQSTCPLNTFRCVSSSRCIVSWWRCDGFPECEDASDEDDCIYGLECGRGRFFCLSDRICLEASQRCDGVLDCSDSTDEMDCPTTAQPATTPPTITPPITTPSTTPPSTTEPSTTSSSTFMGCQPEEFQCATEERCVPQDVLCDGVANCPDQSDEDDCTTTPTQPTTPQDGRVTPDLRLGQGNSTSTITTTTALVRITFDNTDVTTTDPTITSPTTAAATTTAPAVATVAPQVTVSCSPGHVPCTRESCVHERLACLNIARIGCTNMSRDVLDMCQKCRTEGISGRTCLQRTQTAVQRCIGWGWSYNRCLKSGQYQGR